MKVIIFYFMIRQPSSNMKETGILKITPSDEISLLKEHCIPVNIMEKFSSITSLL